MEHFELPHDHGEKSHTAALCRELCSSSSATPTGCASSGC